MDKATQDNEIRARLTANDPSALDLIWTCYASDLFGYLTSMLRSRHDAEDALQDVFVTIVKKRAAVARARLLKPYLFRLSRNVALNRLKRSKRLREREREMSGWLVPAEEDDRREDQAHQVEAALAALPEKQRTVLVLKFYRDKTFLEIGEWLGISENTASSRYRYGIAKLRVHLRRIRHEEGE